MGPLSSAEPVEGLGNAADSRITSGALPLLMAGCWDGGCLAVTCPSWPPRDGGWRRLPGGGVEGDGCSFPVTAPEEDGGMRRPARGGWFSQVRGDPKRGNPAGCACDQRSLLSLRGPRGQWCRLGTEQGHPASAPRANGAEVPRRGAFS